MLQWHMNDGAMERVGIILYAHGARDPRWAEPFEQLLARIRELEPGIPARLAFLEHLEPNLTNAVQALVRQGVRRIRIVPLFFGRGGHLREDFPRHLEAARASAPAVQFEVTDAAGETPAVIEALASFALSELK